MERFEIKTGLSDKKAVVLRNLSRCIELCIDGRVMLKIGDDKTIIWVNDLKELGIPLEVID